MSTSSLLKIAGVFIEHFQDVLDGTTELKAATAGTGALQTLTLTIQPDVPRNVVLTTTNVAAPAGVSIITGTDAAGDTQTETITLVAGGAATGAKAFATITSWTIPAGITAADTVQVASGEVFGLSNRCAAIIKVKNKTVDVGSGSYTLNTTNNTLATAVAGADDLTIWYKSG